MSLFKKPKRKFTQRSLRVDSDEEEHDQTFKLNQQEDNVIDLESTIEEPIKKEPTKNVKLSFDEDGEEQTEFKLKRSSSSIRALKQLEKKRKELKKSSKPFESINQTKSVRKMMETNKESLDERAVNDQQSRVINLDEMDIDDEEDCDYLRKYTEYRKPADRLGAIPDNRTIEMLKRKRFLAKEQESSDFISLWSKNEQTDDYDKFESSSSRLVREDPNDKEAICLDDDEDNLDLDDDRVNFYSDNNSRYKERIKEAFFNAQNEQSNNEDDSENEWERAQIKKGVGVPREQVGDDLDFHSYLNNQRVQSNPNEPPAYIKLTRSALSKDKLLEKYREELRMVTSKLDLLHSQFNNIELTISNIKESLEDESN